MEILRLSARTSSAPFLDMEQEREAKGPLPQPTRSHSISSFVWRTLFLPAMGLIFLAFCYVCRYRIVQVGPNTGPLSHLPIIKAGVTSLSIIFVSLSLLPLSSLLSDLKSEEFFRALADKQQGVRLASLNNASTPSRGPWDSLRSLFNRQGSNYLAPAFSFGFIFLAASALAPAALSVDTVLFDGDIFALPVASIPANSVQRLGNYSVPNDMELSDAVTDLSSRVGSLTWAEISLGVNYSFMSPTVDDTAFVVPMPIGKLTPNVSASWLSDVVFLRPVCEWVAPNILSKNINFTDDSFPNPHIVMNLDSKQIQVDFSILEMPVFISTRISIAPLKTNWSEHYSGQMNKFGEHDDITDGTTVWMAAQCVVGQDPDCPFELGPGENTTSIAAGPDFHSSRLDGTDGRGRDFSFLVCTPNAEIQTRRIRSDGTGLLQVEDSDPIPARQGILHTVQTKLLLSYLFNGFDETGPRGNAKLKGLGNQPQISLFFGNNPNLVQNQVTLLPIETITKFYTRYLQIGMKNFLDGSLGSAYVPSRATRNLAVLSPSMPHVIVSTVLYVILSIFTTVCYFRRPSPHFTLSNVASSLEKSPIPRLFDQFNQSTPDTSGEKFAMAALGRDNVASEKNPDGSQVLKLRNRSPDNSAADYVMLEGQAMRSSSV